MSLFWNLNITKGQGTGKIGSQKWTFIMSGFFSCILLLLGWRISFNNNIFLQWQTLTFLMLYIFQCGAKRWRGTERENNTNTPTFVPSSYFPPFEAMWHRDLAVAFILTYSYWHAGRYCRSVKLMELLWQPFLLVRCMCKNVHCLLY